MIVLSIPTMFTAVGPEKFAAIIGLIIPLWAVFMVILERFFPYTKGIKLFRRGFWLDLVWYTIIQSYVLQILIFDMIIKPIKLYFSISEQGVISHWNFGLIVLFFFVLHDFYIYWFHRFQHNNKYLWRTHEAHHSVREVDWLAGSRSHFIEIIINQTIEFLPIVLLLDAETAMYVVPIKALIDALWGMWIHANVGVNTGKLQYLINGPEMHQWHHANHEEVFYKNYSTKIAVWDWIFGTAFLPKLKPLSFYFNRPVMFGLPYSYPRGFFSQTWYAIKRYDFKEIEQNSIYGQILNVRKVLSTQILGLFKVNKNWVENELFDNNNAKYQEDETTHLCPKCQSKMKYFYQKNQFVSVCESCDLTHENLAKFN